MKYILALLIIASCSNHIDKELLVYRNDFIKYCYEYNNQYCEHIIDYKIYFDVLDNDTAGLCDEKYHIRIDKEYWQEISYTQKELLIFHELGHCFLKRKHKKKSIMQEYLLQDKEYLDNKDYYIKELFKGVLI